MSLFNLKVVIIGLGLTPSTGGPSKTILFFKKALSAKVIAFTDLQKLEREGSSIPGTIHIPNSPNLFGRMFSFSNRRNTERAEYLASDADLLSCHILWRFNSYWTLYLSKKYNIPYIVVPHGSLDPYVFKRNYLIKKIWYVFFGRRFLEGAAHIVCATQKEKDEAMRIYKGNNISVIHWPVDNNFPYFNHADRKSILRKYDISEGQRILLYLGRLHSVKRPIETIQAFMESNPENVVLLLAGPFELYSESDLCRVVEGKEGCGDRVKILGPVYNEEKNEILSISDGLISLSERENFGHSVVESLALGVPVILSPGNYLSKDLQDIGCGWILKDLTNQTAVDAIQNFSKAEQSTLREMGNNGKSWVRKKLTFDRFEQHLRGIVKQCANIPDGKR